MGGWGDGGLMVGDSGRRRCSTRGGFRGMALFKARGSRAIDAIKSTKVGIGIGNAGLGRAKD